VQCIYNIGAAGSPISNADDNGTVIADYPSGTHTVTLAYDESISNVTGNTAIDPAARGGGFFAGAIAISDTIISLEKTASATSFDVAGETITYDYTVTNDGPLPINTGQNVQIQDDKIGTFGCGTVSADIPVGGTISCSANYIVTPADVANDGVTNIARAGVGTGAQAFADRLQSDAETVTVPRFLDPSLAGEKTVSIWDPDGLGLYALPGNDVIYTLTARNDGEAPIDNNSIVLIDVMPPTVEFYNGDIDDAGPETDPVSFTQANGASLTFSAAADVGYSDDAAKPATFAGCDYTPDAGYDPDVTFICFNPKGTLAAGDPDPEFSVSFRARIK
jgi:uncharacterized repeat protein (TIGR01451 family)